MTAVAAAARTLERDVGSLDGPLGEVDRWRGNGPVFPAVQPCPRQKCRTYARFSVTMR